MYNENELWQVYMCIATKNKYPSILSCYVLCLLLIPYNTYKVIKQISLVLHVRIINNYYLL
jgi:hypothetical protein